MMIFFLFMQSELFNQDQILRFADHLYLQEDFNSALNEYRRYLFLSAGDRQEVYAKITDCLVRLKRYEEAIKSVDYFNDTIAAKYAKSRIYLLMGDYSKVRHVLEYMIDDSVARQLIGLSYAGEFNFLKAGEFIEIPQPVPANKSPLLGGLLSLFPGGGHFYAGRVGDGIYSLLVVATGSLITYYYHHGNEQTKFYFALGISAIFYAGNIYGGINAVRNYNYYENMKYREMIFHREQ